MVTGFRNYDEAWQYAHAVTQQADIIRLLHKSRTILISEPNLELLGSRFTYNDYEKFYNQHFAALKVSASHLLTEPTEIITEKKKEVTEAGDEEIDEGYYGNDSDNTLEIEEEEPVLKQEDNNFVLPEQNTETPPAEETPSIKKTTSTETAFPQGTSTEKKGSIDKSDSNKEVKGLSTKKPIQQQEETVVAQPQENAIESSQETIVETPNEKPVLKQEEIIEEKPKEIPQETQNSTEPKKQLEETPLDDEDGIFFFDEDVPDNNSEHISKQKNEVNSKQKNNVKTEKENEKNKTNSNNVKTDKKDKKKDKQKEENSFDLEDEYYELDGF